ncbi:hypothetical protein [Aquamicrobium sp.]|uniref:hypothetical protein n=1 Tax=Aquamicrobium sp. TaxID=1872579 RepID=UPI00258720A4|nr:hypothetical protein [Aquamicrobium sp.]MCK9549317.1 hypothetical protein [Aquamicrobium sp.]
MEKITKTEEDFINQTGYWSAANKTSDKFIDKKAKKLSEKISTKLYEDEIFIEKERVILRNWRDLISLFNDMIFAKKWINYLFKTLLDDYENRKKSIVYHEKSNSYNVEYLQIIDSIERFLIEEYGLDERQIKTFLTPFKYSNYDYKLPMYVLIQVILGINLNVLSTSFELKSTCSMRKHSDYRYYNAMIIEDIKTKELYQFRAIAFCTSGLMGFLEYDLMVRLIREKSNFEFVQKYFGMEALKIIKESGNIKFSFDNRS